MSDGSMEMVPCAAGCCTTLGRTPEVVLLRWQLILGVIHLCFALAFGIYCLASDDGDWPVSPVVRSSVWVSVDPDTDSLTSCDNDSDLACYILAQQQLLNGGTHLAAAINSNHYITMVKESTNYYRFFDYALSASLMWVTINILWATPPDVTAMMAQFWVIAQVVALGFAAEVLGHKASVAYISVWSTGFLVLGFTTSTDMERRSVSNLDGTPLPANFTPPDDIEVPDFVWVITAVLFITFSVFPHQLLRDEIYYGYASFLSKITLAAVIWSGVLARSGSISSGNPSEDGSGSGGSSSQVNLDGDDDFDDGLWAGLGTSRSNATGNYCCGAGAATGGCCASDRCCRHRGSGIDHVGLQAVTSTGAAGAAAGAKYGSDADTSDVGDLTPMSVAQAAAVLRAASRGKPMSTVGMSTEQIAELLQSGTLLADLASANKSAV
eukprot:gene1183-14509_t